MTGLTERAIEGCGEGGIRTPGEREPTLVFETSTIGHSVTSPARETVYRIHICPTSNDSRPPTAEESIENPEVTGKIRFNLDVTLRVPMLGVILAEECCHPGEVSLYQKATENRLGQFRTDSVVVEEVDRDHPDATHPNERTP